MSTLYIVSLRLQTSPKCEIINTINEPNDVHAFFFISNAFSQLSLSVA